MWEAAAAIAAAAAPPGTFLVQTFAAAEANRPALIRCLERRALPRWRALQRRGVLLGNTAYRKTGELNAKPGVDWSALVVSHIPGSASPAPVIRAAEPCLRSARASRLRTELMAATPSSYHPAPAGRIARPGLAYVIEFIDVRNEPGALNEYRETMRTSIGPAVGRLVAEHQFYNMIGLETTRLLYQRPGVLTWNQLHIRGKYGDVGATPPAMTRYMVEANPNLGDFRKVFGRLDAIRTKARDDIAQEVISLRL